MSEGAGDTIGQNGPLLTVVLPNYNHAEFLEQALNALLGQEHPADEIIVVDDASTDGSRDVIGRFVETHPTVRALFNDGNLGALRSLELGLAQARGRYVYFAAADDQVLPGFFALALQMLERDPGIGLFCGETQLIDGASGRPAGLRPVVRPLRRAGCLSADATLALLRRADHFIHTGSSVFRHAAVVEQGGFALEAGSFADGLLARKVALAHGFCFAPQAVSTWHIHAGGLSRSTALDPATARRVLDELPALIAADGRFPPWYPQLFARRWRFAAARVALLETSPDRDLVAAMIPDGRLDRAVAKALLPTAASRMGRAALLAWLALRLRPFRLRDVVLTALVRRFARVT